MSATARAGIASSASALAVKAIRHLEAIERTLGRMLELQQGPRMNFMAAGTVAGSGSAGVTATPVLAANPRRRGLSVQNLAAAGSLTLGLGTTSPIAGTGIVLAPGATWDGRISGAVWPGSLSIVASTAGVQFSWLELIGPSSQPLNEAL
jgi:hypothetical protein